MKAEAGQYEASLVSFDINCSRYRPHYKAIPSTVYRVPITKGQRSKGSMFNVH